MKKLLCKIFGHKVDWSLEAYKKEIEYDLERGGSWLRCKRFGEFYERKNQEIFKNY